ncbi:MAG: twin-arginine translocase TatA/TatE family subunit [Desulfotalea sp.]
MFGIGLPEMILILALALIVIGPDKLPDFARSIAKGIMELRKTADGFKESMEKEGNPLGETKKELEQAANALKSNLLETPNFNPKIDSRLQDKSAAGASAAYEELMKNKINTQIENDDFIEIEEDKIPPMVDDLPQTKKDVKVEEIQ